MQGHAQAEVLAEEVWNSEEFVLGSEDLFAWTFLAVVKKEITQMPKKKG